MRTDLPSKGSQEILARVGVRARQPTPAEARAANAAMAAWVTLPMQAVALVEDLLVPATTTRPAFSIRRFVPKGHDHATSSRALVFFHGGGWVVGTLDGYASLCARLANTLKAQVFSVDYRLSPEVRFPCANQDCQDAFIYLAQESDRLGVDTRQMWVGGDSAGGHLAITVSRWLKRLKHPVQPSAQVLIYPVADRSLSSASAERFAEGFYLSRAAMDWYWRQYLPSDASDSLARDPDISPVLADDLAGLPPTVLVTAACDILRDEGEALAKALEASGVPVAYRCVPGMLHGFIRFDAFCPESQETVEWIASRI
jgi:acetyl esterase